MNEDPFREFFKQKQRENNQDDTPSVKYLAFIPQTLRSNVLLMTSQPLKCDIKTTVFFGTLRPNYRDEMWTTDVIKWKQMFGNQAYFEIPMFPLPESQEQLNANDAIPKIEDALCSLNQLEQGGAIRVVCLGTGYSSFLYDSITYLLKEWRNPNGQPRIGKYMQFVTSGDTAGSDLCNFCQWLCISGVCDIIEFYNTMLYHPFGYCHTAYHRQS